jgi:PqqD family protein of HPr-rel-A system
LTSRHYRWRTIAGGALPHRRWDGDWIVFNPASGNTHILDIVSGELLGVLFAGPRETAHLRARIAEFLDVPNDESLAANVDRVLDVLEELGLVEPDAC